MKPLYRIILFMLICWCGYSAFRQTLSTQAAPFKISGHYNLFLLVILSVTAIIFDIKAYRSYPKLFQFYSSIAGIFFCTVFFVRLITFNSIEKARTIFKASTKTGVKNILSIQFKENGYLKVEALHGPGMNVYYGKYFQDKDTVIIFQTNYDNLAEKLPFSGIIWQNLLLWKNGDTMIIENNRN